MAEDAACELSNLPLEDALQLVYLYAERGSPKYEKAALRWLERYLVEGVVAVHAANHGGNLRSPGDFALALAQEAGVVALTIDDRAHARTDALVELRGVLLQEPEWRRSEGLVRHRLTAGARVTDSQARFTDPASKLAKT